MVNQKKPLFIFEMANNHQGSVEHAKRIIDEINIACTKYKDCFDFAFKFQYRNLDTFIHPDYKSRMDIKNIKRFQDTKLDQTQFKILKDYLVQTGFKTICTPFDEKSVELIDKHEYDFFKVASCSIGDWPLLEEFVKFNKPIIASTAGVDFGEIDKVVNFFKHRNRDLTLMHCVAEYPTPNNNLQLNQIDILKNRYDNITVGYSTHESPDNFEGVKLAIAKGAMVFEKHVGVESDEVSLNEYSATPEQVEKWLLAAYNAFEMCGVIGERYPFTENEVKALEALKRGVYAGGKINEGDILEKEMIFYAFPIQEGQLSAFDMSKYKKFKLKKAVNVNDPIRLADVEIEDNESKVREKVNKVLSILKKANVVIPVNSECEISHHYGLDEFETTGSAIINCVNREYCKKIIVVLPGQKHPAQYHELKEETFDVIYGDLKAKLDNEEIHLFSGESVVVNRGQVHEFTSERGCVFEEISTTHNKSDSFYLDETINQQKNRKTKIYITKKLIDNNED